MQFAVPQMKADPYLAHQRTEDGGKQRLASCAPERLDRAEQPLQLHIEPRVARRRQSVTHLGRNRQVAPENARAAQRAAAAMCAVAKAGAGRLPVAAPPTFRTRPRGDTDSAQPTSCRWRRSPLHLLRPQRPPFVRCDAWGQRVNRTAHVCPPSTLAVRVRIWTSKESRIQFRCARPGGSAFLARPVSSGRGSRRIRPMGRSRDERMISEDTVTSCLPRVRFCRFRRATVSGCRGLTNRHNGRV